MSKYPLSLLCNFVQPPRTAKRPGQITVFCGISPNPPAAAPGFSAFFLSFKVRGAPPGQKKAFPCALFVPAFFRPGASKTAAAPCKERGGAAVFRLCFFFVTFSTFCALSLLGSGRHLYSASLYCYNVWQRPPRRPAAAEQKERTAPATAFLEILRLRCRGGWVRKN